MLWVKFLEPFIVTTIHRGNHPSGKTIKWGISQAPVQNIPLLVLATMNGRWRGRRGGIETVEVSTPHIRSIPNIKVCKHYYTSVKNDMQLFSCHILDLEHHLFHPLATLCRHSPSILRGTFPDKRCVSLLVILCWVCHHNCLRQLSPSLVCKGPSVGDLRSLSYWRSFCVSGSSVLSSFIFSALQIAVGSMIYSPATDTGDV